MLSAIWCMELVAGGDLRKRLRVTRTLPPAVALEVTAQILDALAIVHAAGVVHRDVRPENVLIPDDQRIFVQLADFGVARVVGDDGTYATSTALVGTPSYMAPELAENEPITPAVDVYSVGCLLYEMLAGSVPFTGTPMVVLRRHTDDAPARINTSEAIWAYVSSLLAKDPAHRPTAASAALAARSLTTSLASTAPPVTLPQPDAHDTVMRAPALGDSGSGLGFSLQHATPGASVGETVLRPRVPPQSLNSSVLPCRRRRWILIAVGVVVTMFIVLAVIGSAIGKKDDASSGLPPADGGSGAASGGAAGLRRPAARWARQRSRSAVSLTALSPSAKAWLTVSRP